jgi:E3 ubiquitin-protein ligase RNF115/126
MMGNPRRRRRLSRLEFDEDDDNDNEGGGEMAELDRELDSIIRRRRSSATILQLLQGIRAGMASETENNNSERVILINPFNQTVIVQGRDNQNPNHTPIGSLGDYFVGPGLDMLLHVAENDPNRYGTPPAQKEVVEAMPSVNVKKDKIQCSICLDDFKIGAEAKEMPCKHKFHSECILPWLELHSSCPVCRYQLPADEAKLNSLHRDSHTSASEAEDGTNATERRFSIPWPFNGLFSSSAGGGNSSSSTGSRSGNADEN